MTVTLCPKAFVGYAALTPTLAVHICPDCDDRRQAEAESRSLRIIYKRCPSCYAAHEGRKLGESSE